MAKSQAKPRVALTPEQIAGRAALKLAGTDVATAQAALDKLASDAPAADREAAQALLATAKAKVAEAQAAAQALFTKSPTPPQNTSPAKPAKGGGGNGAAPAADGDLVAAIALSVVYWQGREFAPGDRIKPDLPRSVFNDLVTEGAATPV